MVNEEKVSKRSMILIVPHTSYLDGFIGLLVIHAINLNFKVLAAEYLFVPPFSYGLRKWLHAYPVGKNIRSVIAQSVNIFSDKEESANIVICPEGHRAPTSNWGYGFYKIAKEANIAIDMVQVDYKNRTFALLNTITAEDVQRLDKKEVMDIVRETYKDAKEGAMHPRNFELPNIA